MKVTVERDPLFAALGKARSIIEARSTIPILSNARLMASDGKLAIRGTDLDSQVDVLIDADVEVEGGVTVPAGLAYDIVKGIPKKASIAFEPGEGYQSVMRSGRGRYKLPVLPISDFPDLEVGAFSHEFVCSKELIDDLFGKTQFAISTEETRYYLCGIFFHSMQNEERLHELRACATDGHRLALVARDAPLGAADFPGIIVPAKAVSSLIAMSAGCEDVKISVSQTKVRFDFGNTVLISKVIEGTFPDYMRVIPRGNDKRLIVDREQLMAAVTRCSAVATEKGRAIKMEMSEDGGLVLSVVTSDKGSTREEIDAEFEGGGPLEIGFNPRYLTSIAERMSCDNIIFKLADPGSPTLMVERDGVPDLNVIMPLRV